MENRSCLNLPFLEGAVDSAKGKCADADNMGTIESGDSVAKRLVADREERLLFRFGELVRRAVLPAGFQEYEWTVVGHKEVFEEAARDFESVSDESP